MPNINDAVAGYIKFRDDKKTLQDKHKLELEPVNERLDRLEAWLLKQLHAQGADNIKTSEGTVYIVKRRHVRAADKQVFMNFVKDNSLYALLDIRPNKAAIEEFIESTGDLPPGVAMSTELKANIRR